MYDTTHSNVWHDSFICVTWLIQMCDMTHSYVWHDPFICMTRLTQMCDTTHSQSYVWQSATLGVTHIHICVTLYVWHTSTLCVTLYVWHTSTFVTCLFHTARRKEFIPVTRLIHTCEIIHSYMWHDSFTHLKFSSSVMPLQKKALPDFYSVTYVTCLIRMCHTTGSGWVYESCNQIFYFIFGMSLQSCNQKLVTWFVYWLPHEKLLGIRRVSNPSTSIDPGSLKIGFLVLIQNAGFVRDNGTN